MQDEPGALIRALESTVHRIAARLPGELGDLRLDQAQVHVLSFLAAGQPRAVGEIHAEFGHRPSTVTSVLDRLERRGLVERTVNPRDRRSILVRLTPEGETAAGRVLEVVGEIEARTAAELGPDGLGALRRSLDALAAALDETPARRRIP